MHRLVSLFECLLIVSIVEAERAGRRLRERLRRRPPPAPCPFAEQADAIRVLERDRLLSAGEAHALRAGERLSDLYAEVAEGEAGVSLDQLEEVERLIRAGDLPEAALQLGRLHPALRDFPALLHRSATRARL